MSKQYTVKIDEVKQAMRLDKALSIQIDDVSRTKITEYIKDGCVYLHDKKIDDPKYKTKLDEVFILNMPDAKPSEVLPENIELDIVYEDEDILVINKQVGLVVHPGAGRQNGTLVNALLYHYKESLSNIGGDLRPGIVHRLDADTSGLMMVAKNDSAHMKLAEQFAKRIAKRKYVAFCWGCPVPLIGKIEKNIGRHPKDRKKMTVLPEEFGKFARTNYKVLKAFGNQAASLVQLELDTGRTHQIRVHMTHLGYPLIGDKVYRKNNYIKNDLSDRQWQEAKNFSRQALHATSLTFIHPKTDEEMTFSTEIPADMAELLTILYGQKLPILSILK